MADSFQPKFADLVRNYSTTTGTGDLVLGKAVAGFKSFTDALQPGDEFYYTVAGVDKVNETEVGRGTLLPGGKVSRQPSNGAPTNFTNGLKSVALVASAEWYASVHDRAGDGDKGDVSIAGGVWSIDANAPNIANKVQHAASRTALAAASTAVPAAYLRESGRQGVFLFDSGDLSAKVSADTAQGIYVAPATSPSGSSGAWVRVVDSAVHEASWWGVAGDDATDNASAIQAAIDTIKSRQYLSDPSSPIRFGIKTLRFPAAIVRYGSTLAIDGDIRLEGGGGDGSTVLHYTGTGRPAYVNSLDGAYPNGPQNVRSFESDGIIWYSPLATQPFFIGNSTQRRVQFMRGQMRGTVNSEYAIYCGDAVYCLHLHQFEFVRCDKGIYVGHYCDLFTMDGRSINFYNKREVLTLACPTALIENVDFEVGNMDNLSAGSSCFVRIIQAPEVAGKNRNITFRTVRFGPEANPGIRTVEYDVIFDNVGAVTSADTTSGVVFDNCKHFSQTSGIAQKIAPINIRSRVKSNSFNNNYHSGYSAGYYITSSEPGTAMATGSGANNRTTKLSDVDPAIRAWFVSDEAAFAQAWTANATLPSSGLVAYAFSGYSGSTIPTGSNKVAALAGGTLGVNYDKCVGITAHGEGVAERPIYLAVNGALIDTSLDASASQFNAPVYAGANGVLSLTPTTTPLQVGRVQTLSANARIRVDIRNEELTTTVANANFSIVCRARLFTINYAAAITADRTVALHTTSPRQGDKVRVVRQASATGAFVVNIAALKALGAGQWGEAEYVGSAWVLTGFGSL